MSNNPRTKAWRRRAERLAREFVYASVTDTVSALDPDASDYLIRTALQIAADDCAESSLRFRRTADEYGERAAILSAELARRQAPRLRVVGTQQDSSPMVLP